MTRRAAACAVLAALPLLSNAATHPPEPRPQNADRLAIEALEQRWIADIDAGNRDDLATILADNYRDIDWQGHLRDKQALLDALHKPANATQRVTQLQVRTWGDTAVATGTNEVRSSHKGWAVEVSFTDVFARIDGRWRAVSSQETLRKPPPPANRH